VRRSKRELSSATVRGPELQRYVAPLVNDEDAPGLRIVRDCPEQFLEAVAIGCHRAPKNKAI